MSETVGEQREEVRLATALQTEGVLRNCPICDNGSWALLNRPGEDIGPVAKFPEKPLNKNHSMILSALSPSCAGDAGI